MEKETKIYLWVTNEGWKEFKLSDKEELAKRNIVISNGAKIGDEAQIGDGAQIGYEAKIGDGAKIGYGAQIGYEAKIGYGAQIGYKAKIGYGAQIGYKAQIGDGAKIGDEAQIGDGAKIGDGAQIGDGANPQCLFLTGSNHSVYYWGENKIQIGCKQHSIEEWEAQYKMIGKSQSYSESQISEYSIYISMIKNYHLSQQNNG